MLLWSSANNVTYTYNYGPLSITNGTGTIAANAWSITYFGNRGGNMGAGCTTFASFGIQPDVGKNSRHSFIHSFRGGNTVTLDVLDIAGAIAGTWENNAVYDGNTKTLTTGSCGKYAPCTENGRFGYLNSYTASLINQIFRYDVQNRVMQNFTPTDWIQSGTAASGDRIATYVAIDGDNKYTMVYLQAHLSTIGQEIVVLA
jgi:hypothetical protein